MFPRKRPKRVENAASVESKKWCVVEEKWKEGSSRGREGEEGGMYKIFDGVGIEGLSSRGGLSVYF